MTPARHAEVRGLFAAALRWQAAARAEVVRALAGDDGALADEVLGLLALADEPAVTTAAPPRGARAHAAPALTVTAPWPLARVLTELAAIGAAPTAGDAAGATGEDRDDDGDDEAPWTLADAALRAPEELDPSLGPRGPWTEAYVAALIVVALLGGRPPAAGLTATTIIARARRDDARPTLAAPGEPVAPAVEAALARALARRPLDRTQSPQRLWAQLAAAAAVEPGAALPRPPAAPLSPPPRAGRLAVAAVVAIAVALALALR